MGEARTKQAIRRGASPSLIEGNSGKSLASRGFELCIENQ